MTCAFLMSSCRRTPIHKAAGYSRTYFPNRWLPMHAVSLTISRQLQTRVEGDGYHHLDAGAAFDLDASIPRTLTARDPKTRRTAINHENYVRLSPGTKAKRVNVTEIWGTAKHAIQRDFVPRRYF